jgi:hypothetical protein
MDEVLLCAMAECGELLDWLRTMADDKDFMSMLEMAMVVCGTCALRGSKWIVCICVAFA